ncbi:MAG: hypothetical protein IT236_13320 [Bacteroidia bacterium]|nr:hypothetical protein [Bacteroidia bacterium]
MNNDKEVLFTNEALARFVAAQGRAVEKVVCHLWQNSSNKNDVVEIIDNVELHFGAGQKLCISCNFDGDGLDAIDYDYRAACRAIDKEFEGKIKIYSIDASGTTIWKEVIGKTLVVVAVTRSGEHYKADSVVLDFGEEKREIAIAPLDGLVIDYYEE